MNCQFCYPPRLGFSYPPAVLCPDGASPLVSPSPLPSAARANRDSTAVALSGGPDSICLLSLLQRARLGLPLRSITIDHALQPTSRDSALRTRARSEAIGVPGIVLPAEWDGSIPKKGEAVEEAARDARYRALWRGLQSGESGTVMFGHHADDQLETVIMRVLRGTGTYGLGGMRAVRRWGWVDQGATRSRTSGHPLRGMETYIARPLLPIPKERILATCHTHSLEYEQDVTNFIPDLTVRNAVRYALGCASRPMHGAMSTRGEYGPTDTMHGSIISDRIRGSIPTGAIQAAINHVHTLAGGTGNPDLNLMRAYVGKMSARVRQVDELVTDYLRIHTRPCPPSTLLLVPSQQPMEKDTTHALVHRILRYVSPHPWGTPESEAHRRSSSIEQIVQKVLHEQDHDRVSSFCAGAHVLWSPIWTRPDGAIRTRRAGEQSGGRAKGWIASRQPPAASLEQTVHPGETVLWDNRFLIRVPDGPDLVVRPRGQFVLPQLVRNQRAVDGCGVEFIRELDAI